jgi:2-dehydro-3-deoxyphosphogluconate aldolase/(4S)-4-hydroxy-2-oxoglutarate aldolase
MNKTQVLQQIMDVGIIPVIRAASAEDAFLAAEAVSKGGIPIVEITMTVPGANEVIRSLVQRSKDLLIGAGTVLDARMARQCVDAGAQFLVSPGLNLETVAFARAEGKVMMAGALTPTEVITAWSAGSDVVKIFPCSAVGGAKYIKALKGPFPQVAMVPTGGVNLSTAADFILAGASALGVGGELVDAGALKSRNLDVITQNARSFVELVRKTRMQVQTAARPASGKR